MKHMVWNSLRLEPLIPPCFLETLLPPLVMLTILHRPCYRLRIMCCWWGQNRQRWMLEGCWEAQQHSYILPYWIIPRHESWLLFKCYSWRLSVRTSLSSMPYIHSSPLGQTWSLLNNTVLTLQSELIREVRWISGCEFLLFKPIGWSTTIKLLSPDDLCIELKKYVVHGLELYLRSISCCH